MSNLDQLSITDTIIGDSSTKKQIFDAFKMLINLMKELKKNLDKDVQNIDSKVGSHNQEISNLISSFEQKIKQLQASKEWEKPISQLKDAIQDVRESIPVIPKFSTVELENRINKLEDKPIVIDPRIEELEQEIEDLKEKIKNISVGNRGTIFGGRAGIQILGSSTKVGTKTNEIDFTTGLTVTNTNGRITVAASAGGVTFVENETVSGSSTTFTLANTPVAGSVHVFALGQRLVLTTDYSISGTTITTVSSWSAGQITADYRK